MDTILQGIPNVICYINDIPIPGPDDAQHLKNLAEVLCRLEQYGLHLKKTKGRFLQPAIEYLDHRVDAEGLHTTDEKQDAILQALELQNLYQLRSFLGLLNYGKSIPNLAMILHPLHSLLCRDAKWNWGESYVKTFELAKKVLSSSHVFVHYNLDYPINLAGDASTCGLDAVISHMLPDGNERPMAYASRTFPPAECKYAQLEKEATSLIFGIYKFHKYRNAKKCTLITDIKPLMAILGPKKGIPHSQWLICTDRHYSYLHTLMI